MKTPATLSACPPMLWMKWCWTLAVSLSNRFQDRSGQTLMLVLFMSVHSPQQVVARRLQARDGPILRRITVMGAGTQLVICLKTVTIMRMSARLQWATEGIKIKGVFLGSYQFQKKNWEGRLEKLSAPLMDVGGGWLWTTWLPRCSGSALLLFSLQKLSWRRYRSKWSTFCGQAFSGPNQQCCTYFWLEGGRSWGISAVISQFGKFRLCFVFSINHNPELRRLLCCCVVAWKSELW